MKVKAFIESESLNTESAVFNSVSAAAVTAAKTCLNKAGERETATAVKESAAYSAVSRSVLSAFTPKGKAAKPLIVGGAVYNIGTLSGFLKQTGKKIPRRAFREVAEITPFGVTFTIDIRYTASECRRIRATAAVIAAHTERTKVKAAERKECLGW